MKSFVSYLKKQSPPAQLSSGSTGWLELPDGRRWNPSHIYKFNAQQVAKPMPFWRQMIKFWGGSHAL